MYWTLPGDCYEIVHLGSATYLDSCGIIVPGEYAQRSVNVIGPVMMDCNSASIGMSPL